jgi:hypothetical protein
LNLGAELACFKHRSLVSGKGGAMNKFLVSLIFLALCGCGLEAAGTAATSASLKKKELEEGQKTMQRVEDRIGQVNQQAADRVRDLDE